MYQFPDPLAADGDVVCIGGNLSPGMLLSAYRQGIFPWFNDGDPILWQSPDPRFVIFPQNLHVSDSMCKILKKKRFVISFDCDFHAVISECAAVRRRGQDGSWITGDMIGAYSELHRLGFAHSAEARLDGCLVGGCYGVRIGGVFFGESMFSKVSNASKAAFLTFAASLFDDGLAFIDCQVYSAHLESMGGTALSRKDFISLLPPATHQRPPVGFISATR
ncbi:MAG: leucyl/phenylalanyl-tRNA--protein transferase [Spirochaetaceae bacterium]|nr:leucyl/phenylalanyl-tRNA--protein transferase [Spirochaetaceae bacterium]